MVAVPEHPTRTRFIATTPNWIAFDKLLEPTDVQARIRYNAPESPARIFPVDENTVEVELRTAQRAIAPGQAAVFYWDEQVVGGATIDKVLE